NLSRARGDPAPDGRVSYGFAQSDFDRTEHQRQILSAVKAELNWKLILDPRKNSQILDAMANNIKTNVRAGEAKPLFSLFNSIPQSKLKSLSLRDLDGKNYLVSTQYEGDTLSPAAGLSDFSQINSVLQKLNNQ
ncbi:MAG TPA: hypothetical protein VFW90_03040, partial [Candidatus Saccharimonadales bacterium]|nr:hypothetical protein [Candidatus Saccharimonadales bacterium]